MTNIINFNNEIFGDIKVIQKDGQAWFIGKDVANVLGYKNTRDALKNHVDDEDKSNVAIYDGSQNRAMTIINESGLYSLILRSKLPAAKDFKRWVTGEVIPSIRQNGAYISSNITEEQEKKLDKYATTKKIKEYFATSNLENLETEITECLEYYKNTNAITKIKIKKTLVKTLENRQALAIDNSKLPFAYILLDSINNLNKSIKSTSCRSYGQKIRCAKKYIKELENFIEYREPYIEEYHTINYHAFSSNYIFAAKNNKLVPSNAYQNWKNSFPLEEIPADLDLDFTQHIHIWLKFDHMQKLDVQNLSKTFIDYFCHFYHVDDNLVQIMECSTNSYVEDYSQGKIYFCIKNA